MKWGGGPLPSHLTQAQVSRLLSTTAAAIYHRLISTTPSVKIPFEEVLGVKMIKVSDLVASGLFAVGGPHEE